MSDLTNQGPFQPFLPNPPAVEAPKEAPKTRRKRAATTSPNRRATKQAAKKAAAPAEPPKRARKPRTPRPATVSIDLLVVAAGLDERAAQVFAGVAQALSGLRKPSRRKLVEALQKLS